MFNGSANCRQNTQAAAGRCEQQGAESNTTHTCAAPSIAAMLAYVQVVHESKHCLDGFAAQVPFRGNSGHKPQQKEHNMYRTPASEYYTQQAQHCHLSKLHPTPLAHRLFLQQVWCIYAKHFVPSPYSPRHWLSCFWMPKQSRKWLRFGPSLPKHAIIFEGLNSHVLTLLPSSVLLNIMK
jgi:hypothetical protein